MSDQVEKKAPPGKFRVIEVDCWKPPPDISVRGDHDSLEAAIADADEVDGRHTSSFAEVFDATGTSVYKTANLKRLEEKRAARSK